MHAAFPRNIVIVVLGALIVSCAGVRAQKTPAIIGYGPNPTLPKPTPTLIPTVNIAEAKGWQEGVMPTPAKGLRVSAFAIGLDHPRWLHVLPNGDVLVAETNAPAKHDDGFSLRKLFMNQAMKRAGAATESANRITLLRDTNGDGIADERRIFAEGLNSPFGMTLSNGKLYVANTDALVAFPYSNGQTRVAAPPEKIVGLPAGDINHHWTKDVIASQDGRKLYVTVGSNSNAGENGLEAEKNRAAVLEVDRSTRRTRVFASGLRNPNGLSWNPETGELWVAVNERDEIGDDLVPDYITSVRNGSFYGWPYSYYGQNVDERVKPQRPDLVAAAVKPDYALGSHTASLGLAFSTGASLGPAFGNGAFVGQHGSWNRSLHSGYKVIFVPFRGGKPSGPPKDVLIGFLGRDGKAMGRPVGVAVDRTGALLVADDVGNVIWRVSRANGH
ncbi:MULTISPECIES: sorbosone dehydrogenase family protein [unclassified Mesorhizobium]|uniref:PQQ-dependent sugar dehydrogenase n=1 Tax=unclassified Mesorhizobium TaxID=325217 RepID=UPI000F75A016|nr:MULTISPECIES: sorbosone dehydrogenase family protein [unclassified Mesorhizobium]AZO28498.1 sorbosone dehydrogenase family protein [Mesorhizobium sp. M1B.F.Ca.ET.045.04.1.1]RWB20910.1 MAG: sorbosone dehydrogenase family protein [Mesorhizobium sp.]RWE03191.1 MAG: sorbosone dehydrogenase family protein [Mesorhizobium sp.]TIS49214.1 MAG: sorbosone dehydrogenase family protein [Mesorhizobium sp.]